MSRFETIVSAEEVAQFVELQACAKSDSEFLFLANRIELSEQNSPEVWATNWQDIVWPEVDIARIKLMNRLC